jgi:hypothetical protein
MQPYFPPAGGALPTPPHAHALPQHYAPPPPPQQPPAADAPSPLGLLIPGRPISPDFAMTSPTQFTAAIPAPGGVPELAVFLVPGQALPQGCRACTRLLLCAAEAFRNVCAHCEKHLALAPLASGERLLSALVPAVCALLGGGARLALGDGADAGVDTRVPLAEGLGRLVAKLGATDSASARRSWPSGVNRVLTCRE